MKKLGLYIHIPFCESKCHYCDFYSITQSTSDMKEVYIKSLIKELESNKKILDGCEFDTVFIGGGTPSSIDAKFYEELFYYLRKNSLTYNDAEITMEINPKNRGYDYLNKIKEIGVNRLSVGIQTFDDDILRIIGRNHSRKEGEAFLEKVNKVGFNNLSCDLIFNLPLQKYHHIEKDIDILEDYNVKHISIYSLKVNENTKMNDIVKIDKYKLMDEDEERETYYAARKHMDKKGYIQYEISNFAKGGYQSQHNLKYWNRMEYLGIGASAHSFINNKRYSNSSNVVEYIEKIKSNKSPKDFEELVDKEEAIWEYLILGLRKTEGIKISEFEKTFNISFSDFDDKIKNIIENDLAEITTDKLRLTKKGMDLSNYVFIKLK
ncbi:MAG: radical SAM family heme chaperone HemW [Bacillota bacterium]|nr:radical SAM family heme chaperone HemW [Bacillota bacterium]